MSDNVIFSYGRQQALSDGVLVDVSDLAREAGFRIPAAVHQDRDCIFFKVLFILTRGCPPEPVSLKAIYGPGDDGEPVLAILLPFED
jgi:hypothetical protein